MTSLDDLFVSQLRDLYSAEKQLTSALPKIARDVENEDLREAIEEHLRQTRGHVDRLDRAFDMLGESSRGPKCKGMEGLLEEGEEHISEADGATRDAVIIASAQRVEHYEIAGYGTAATYATMLGRNDVAKLLGQTLEEEKATDRKLTTLAERHINAESAGAEPSEARGVRTSGRAGTVSDRGRTGNSRSRNRSGAGRGQSRARRTTGRRR
jgi:ferritin-like metal-binding protein YciE